MSGGLILSTRSPFSSRPLYELLFVGGGGNGGRFRFLPEIRGLLAGGVDVISVF